MRKGRDGGKKEKKREKQGKKTDDYSGHYVIASSRPPERRTLERCTLMPKRLMIIVATMSLPAVDRPPADRWNAARSRQNLCIDASESNSNFKCILGPKRFWVKKSVG